MNFEQQLCQAIDLIAHDAQEQAESLIEATILEIKRYLPEALEKAPLYFYWAQSLELLEEAEQAALQYESSLKADGQYIPAWEALCRLLLEDLDRPEEAKSILLGRLLPLEPENEIYQDWFAKVELALNNHQFKPKESANLGQEN